MTLTQNDQFWSAGAVQNAIWAANQLATEEISLGEDPISGEPLEWVKHICVLLSLEY